MLFADLRLELGIGPDAPGIVLHGPPAAALVELTEEDDVELLVMGSRGRGSIRRALLGSVSSQVAARAARPVMVVPPACPESRGSEAVRGGIVCGVGDARGDAPVLRLATEMATRLGTSLRVVHADRGATLPAAVPAQPPGSVFSPAALPAGEFARDLVLLGFRGELSISVMPPPVALEAVGRAEAARMIVVGSGRAGRFGGQATGTTLVTLAANADRPVLVLPRAAAGEGEPATPAVDDEERSTADEPVA
jgi:nucleotide-binding universal stress UspA family protein